MLGEDWTSLSGVVIDIESQSESFSLCECESHSRPCRRSLLKTRQSSELVSVTHESCHRRRSVTVSENCQLHDWQILKTPAASTDTVLCSVGYCSQGIFFRGFRWIVKKGKKNNNNLTIFFRCCHIWLPILLAKVGSTKTASRWQPCFLFMLIT